MFGYFNVSSYSHIWNIYAIKEDGLNNDGNKFSENPFGKNCVN